MKLAFNIIIVFMTGVFLQSCHDNKDIFESLSLDDFNEIYIENLQKWEGAPDNQFIGAIYSQEQQYAVFMPMDSCMIHFYDNDMNFLYSRVVVGQGPGEFVSPYYCGQWERLDSIIITDVFDTTTGSILKVSPLYHGGKEVAQLPIDIGLSPVFMISDPTNEYLYGVSSYLSCDYGRGVMFKYTVDTGELSYSLPSFNVENHNNAFYLMQKGTAAGYDCQLFINAYLYEPILEIWDANLKLIKAWQLKDVNLVDADFNYENATSFFRGAQIGKKNIYTLYYGRQYGQPGDSFLLAFDHSYTPVFKVNIGNSYWFTINETTNKIIMLRRDDNEEPVTYIATLPSSIDD